MAQTAEQNLFDQHGHINYDKVVEHVHKKLITFLTSSLTESFHRSNDPKFRKQFTEIDKNTRNEAFKAFISKQKNISSSFHAEFESNYYTSSTSITRSTINSSQIRAIETDLIELTLAVDILIKKGEEHNKLSLEVLKLRMQELSYYALVEFNINCLNPNTFFPIFQNAIFQLHISVEAKIFLCKIISQFVIPNLSAFYSEVNEFLMQMNILPAPKDIEYAKSSENIPNDNIDAAETSDINMSTGQFFAFLESDSSENNEIQTNARNELSSDIRQPTNTIEHDDDASRAGKSGLDQNTIGVILQPYNSNIRNDSSPGQRREFVRALSTVQRVESSNNAIFKPVQIKTAIRRTLHEKGALDAEKIVSNEEEIIDFVSNIFKVILDDDTLCVEIKNLLSKLQISIIKLALVDFTFFQNVDHPARKLLNKLTSIGIEIDSGKGVLYTRLKSIINLVSENFSTDVQIFELALAEINKLDSLNLDEIQAEDDKNKHNLASSSRRTAAKRTVIHTIKKYLNERSLPNVMLEFCLKCWAPHMGVIYIEYGKNSKQWRKSVRTLRRVIEVSQAVHTIEQVEQYIPEPYEFFEYIRGELEYLSAETEEFEVIIESAEYWYASYINDIDTQDDETEDDIKSTVAETKAIEEKAIAEAKAAIAEEKAAAAEAKAASIEAKAEVAKAKAKEEKAAAEAKAAIAEAKAIEAEGKAAAAEEKILESEKIKAKEEKAASEKTEISTTKSKIHTKQDEDALAKADSNKEDIVDVSSKLPNTASVSGTLIQTRDDIEEYIAQKEKEENAHKKQIDSKEETKDSIKASNHTLETKTTETIAPISHTDSTAEDKFTLDNLPKNIVPGAWLEIYQGEEKAKRRLKFSNINKNTESLTFTDRSGDYRLEIDVNTFMHDLNSGRTRLMIESNRFDLALSSVISNIRGEQNKFKDLN